MPWDERTKRRLKLRDLDILLAVVETGSMGKAAKRLNISQPAVSKAVVELEDVRRRRHAVAEAVAELAIDLDHEAVRRRGCAHAATGSGTVSVSASAFLRSSRCRREMTSRWTWAVPSKIW